MSRDDVYLVAGWWLSLRGVVGRGCRRKEFLLGGVEQRSELLGAVC